MKSVGYTIITFEELMQDLNQNNMKKKFKHKITGYIVEEMDTFYLLKNHGNFPRWAIENSQDWEEIKPEFKVGDIVHIVQADICSTKHNYFGEIIRLKAHNIYPILVKTNRDITGYTEIYCSEVRLATSEEILEYNKPKKGDYMIHIAHDTQYWTMGKIFQFGAYDFSTNDEMIFELKNNKIYSARAYTKNCRKATPEEIQAYKESQELRIGEHKLEIIQDGNFTNKAKFGCQQFDINELRTIRRLFDSNIQAKVNILGVDITSEFLDKIIAKF